MAGEKLVRALQNLAKACVSVSRKALVGYRKPARIEIAGGNIIL